MMLLLVVCWSARVGTTAGSGTHEMVFNKVIYDIVCVSADLTYAKRLLPPPPLVKADMLVGASPPHLT